MYHRSWYIKKIIYLSRIWNTQTTIELTQLDDQRRRPGGREARCPIIILFFSKWPLIYISRSLFGQVPPVIGVQFPWLCAPTCLDILQQGSLLSQYLSNDRSLHVMESVFRNPWNFCLWNPESWAMESGIHVKESGILLRIRGTQRQFSKNICSEDDLRSRIFGTFVVKFLACLPLLGFSNI